MLESVWHWYVGLCARISFAISSFTLLPRCVMERFQSFELSRLLTAWNWFGVNQVFWNKMQAPLEPWSIRDGYSSPSFEPHSTSRTTSFRSALRNGWMYFAKFSWFLWTDKLFKYEDSCGLMHRTVIYFSKQCFNNGLLIGSFEVVRSCDLMHFGPLQEDPIRCPEMLTFILSRTNSSWHVQKQPWTFTSWSILVAGKLRKFVRCVLVSDSEESSGPAESVNLELSHISDLALLWFWLWNIVYNKTVFAFI